MSTILYYSVHCPHSSKLLATLGKTRLQNEMHFVCIDNRVTENGNTYVILKNGQKLVFPNTITRVPALFLLSNYTILYGADIEAHIKPEFQGEIAKATRGNMEPVDFSFSSSSGGSVRSDTFGMLNPSAHDAVPTNAFNLDRHGSEQTPAELYYNAVLTEEASVKIKDGEINTDDLLKSRNEDIQRILPSNNPYFETR